MKTNKQIIEEAKRIIENDAKEYYGLLSARNYQQFKRLIEQEEAGIEPSKYDWLELLELLKQNYCSNINLDGDELEFLSDDELAELERFETEELIKNENEISDYLISFRK